MKYTVKPSTKFQKDVKRIQRRGYDIVVDRGNTGSEFRRLDPEQLKLWLNGDYTLGDLWNKNVLGGRLTK